MCFEKKEHHAVVKRTIITTLYSKGKRCVMDTINALLHNTNSLRNATILAGSRGLNNKISGVTVLEMSDLNEEGSSLLNLKQSTVYKGLHRVTV